MNNICFAVIATSTMTIAACTEMDTSDAEFDSGSEALESTGLDGQAPKVVANATFSDCDVGEICFFTGANGSGSMCSWTAHDTDWASGSAQCSWATTSNVCSVFNRMNRRVEYFTSTNYVNRIGSEFSNSATNLACTYKLRSHRPL
jgi:hypothetical protein